MSSKLGLTGMLTTSCLGTWPLFCVCAPHRITRGRKWVTVVWAFCKGCNTQITHLAIRDHAICDEGAAGASTIWCRPRKNNGEKTYIDHSWHVQRAFISSCGFQEQLMGCLLLGCQLFGIRMWNLARTGIWNGCRISTISLSKQMGFGPRVFVNFDQFWQISTTPFVHLGQRAQFELCSIHCHLGQWRAQDAGRKTYKLDLEFARWHSWRVCQVT